MNERTGSTSTNMDPCVHVPDFERLNFYYGQPLGVDEFRLEQHYFLEKLRLYNRCFHGTGIVCGLEVVPVAAEEDCEDELSRRRLALEKAIEQIDKRIAVLEEKMRQEGEDEKNLEELRDLWSKREVLERELEQLPDCPPKEEKVSAEVCVNCGWALDCEGREIIVRNPAKVDLRALLPPEELLRIESEIKGDERVTIELSVCYCEQPTHPSRPVMTDTCAPVSRCVNGRTREGFEFRVSLPPRDPDNRCSNCCDPCEHECVVLAHIHWNPSEPITWKDIDWRPRRKVSLYRAAVITGVSWLHGAGYSPDQAQQVLGTEPYIDPKTETPEFPRTDGIEVEFSRKVYAETLQPGVVDLWRIQGPPGPSGMITHIQGEYVDKPDSGLIRSFKYRDITGETLNSGDRVLIVIRGNFILDECCQPVDGEHVGGRIPQFHDYKNDWIDKESLPPAPPCAREPRAPWTSGNGRPGATFESWFFIN